MPLVEEVLLGGAVGALIQAIFHAKERATFFKRTLEHLQSTLQSVVPIMEQVIQSEQAQNDVFIKFIQQLEKAKILVDMYSDIRRWRLLKKRKVKKLIQQMDASLQRFLTGDFQAQQLLFLTNIDKDVSELNKKMDQIIELLEREKESSFAEPNTEEGNIGSAFPEPANEEISLSPLRNVSGDNRFNCDSPAFELRWKMSKDRCLEVRFWRSCHE